jgi:hypothetical protein
MAVLPSPLSNSIQGINESTVSGSVFGGNRQDPETKSTLQSLSSSVVSLQNQVNQLNNNNITNVKVFSNFQQSFSTQIDSVRLQLNKVNETLESVATITASESALEKQKDLYEQEKEKRLAEAGARGGKENLLETKIQSALSEPVNRIGNKVSFGFQNLMSFIMTLLGGWLTLEGIKAIKAYQDGDKKQLDDIKNSVIKTLAIAGGIFGVINFGIGRVIGTITGLVAKIGKFIVGGLIIKPFQTVATGLRNVLPGRTVAPPKPPGPKGPVKGPNFLGGALNLYTALRNYGNGEITDTVMQGVLGALLLTPAGRLVSAVRTLLGVAVTADEIAEVFGSNIFGENPDTLKKAKQVKELAEKEAQDNKKNKLTASPLKKPEAPKPEDAKPAPTTTMVPPASNLQINPPTSTPSSTSATTPPSTPTPSSTSATTTPTSIPSTPVATSTPTSAESSKPAPVPSSTLPLVPAPAETSSKPSIPIITPAETSKVPTLPFNVGPEPEPKPNIIYTSSGSPTPPPQQPLKSGPASDVPAIPSSNPDNFYTLYSQINYNVVI